MKTKRLIFVVTVLILVASTCTVWGATYNGTDRQRDKTYVKYLEGNRTQLCAAGTSTYAYSTMYNEYTENCQVSVSVLEYSYFHETFVASSADASYLQPGYSMGSGSIERKISNVAVDYYHRGICYLSPYGGAQYESFEYIADQYYE